MRMVTSQFSMCPTDELAFNAQTKQKHLNNSQSVFAHVQPFSHSKLTIFLSSSAYSLFCAQSGTHTIPTGTMQFVLRSVYCCLTITDQYYDICTFHFLCLFAHILSRLIEISSVYIYYSLQLLFYCLWTRKCLPRLRRANPRNGNAWILPFEWCLAKKSISSRSVLATITLYQPNECGREPFERNTPLLW